MPTNFGVGMVLHGKTLGIWGYGRIGKLVAGYARPLHEGADLGSEASRKHAVADGYEAADSREAFSKPPMCSACTCAW